MVDKFPRMGTPGLKIIVEGIEDVRSPLHDAVIKFAQADIKRFLHGQRQNQGIGGSPMQTGQWHANSDISLRYVNHFGLEVLYIKPSAPLLEELLPVVEMPPEHPTWLEICTFGAALHYVQLSFAVPDASYVDPLFESGAQDFYIGTVPEENDAFYGQFDFLDFSDKAFIRYSQSSVVLGSSLLHIPLHPYWLPQRLFEGDIIREEHNGHLLDYDNPLYIKSQVGTSEAIPGASHTQIIINLDKYYARFGPKTSLVADIYLGAGSTLGISYPVGPVTVRARTYKDGGWYQAWNRDNGISSDSIYTYPSASDDPSLPMLAIAPIGDIPAGMEDARPDYPVFQEAIAENTVTPTTVATVDVSEPGPGDYACTLRYNDQPEKIKYGDNLVQLKPNLAVSRR